MLLSLFSKNKKQTNMQKMKNMSVKQLSNFLGEEIYSVFRFSLTKKEFTEKLEHWLMSVPELKDSEK